MSARRVKNKTLSEKISESFIPKALADPERDSEDETAAKLADIEDEDIFVNNKLSDFRKRNVKLLSEYGEKYRGRVVSRKDFEEEEQEITTEEDDDVGSNGVGDNQEVTSEDSDENDLEEYRKKLQDKCSIESEQDDNANEDSSGIDDDSDDDDNPMSDSEEEDDSDYNSAGELEEGNESVEEENDVTEEDAEGEECQDKVTKLVSKVDNTTEIQKGLAVQNQLKLWEKLLEVRIHSQKMLFKANSLPLTEKFNDLYEKDKEFSNLAKETQSNVSQLLDNMLEMQQILMKQYSETKDLVQKSGKRPLNSQTDQSEEPPSKRFASSLQETFESFRTYRNSVLSKWNDRTKMLTPGAGSKRKSLSEDFDVVKKIEVSLLNKSDLVKKSQLVKGNYKLFDCDSIRESQPDTSREDEDTKYEKQEDISSVEIYDDTDFYHQQLRELIEYKTNTTSSPAEMSKQFAELQKLRQKMKKKVDTRASKGRKIRYVVHNKLVSFMAPNPHSSWTDESKTELYRSLFGS